MQLIDLKEKCENYPVHRVLINKISAKMPGTHSKLQSDFRPFECNLCDKKFKTKGAVLHHSMWRHSDNRPHKCNLCPKAFKIGYVLQRHIRLRHESPRIHCVFCGASFVDQSSINYHLRMHIGEKVYQCDQCPQWCLTKAHLKNHLETQHNSENVTLYSCDQCSVKCKTEAGISRHKLNHHNPENPKVLTQKCLFCDARFSENANLQLNSHYYTHTMEKPFWCPLCGWEFNQTYRVANHILLHTGETPFACKYEGCGSSFPSKLTLSHHLNRYHNSNKSSRKPKVNNESVPNNYKCEYCQKTISSKGRLRAHMNKFHSEKSLYTCKICGQGFTDERYFSRHQTDHHLENFCCPTCHIQYKSKYTLQKHLIQAHSRPEDKPCFTCELCDKSYPRKDTYQRHIKTVHTNHRTYNCHLCNYSTVYSHGLKNHLQTHQNKLKEPELSCSLCDKPFHTDQRLKHHFKVHVDERPYKCNMCSKAFKTSDVLRRHKRLIHAPNKIRCVFCDFSFHDNKNMYYHLRIHIKEKVNPCHKCGQWFLNKTHLMGHMQRNHNPNKSVYACDKCTMKCCKKSTLDKHKLRFHNEDGNAPGYTCVFCDKWFPHKHRLDYHLNSHTGEKPYECLLCSRGFTDRGNMTVHLKCHTGEKAYKCDWEGCGQAFSQPRRLRAHLEVHKRSKKFLCAFCRNTRSFATREMLTDHQKRHNLKRLLN